jgi:RNA polymerase sigma-70 factor (ECF subfamily)
MTGPSPDDLAGRARVGEPGAFDAFVRVTSAQCYALALRLTGNEADAADVVQDAYLRAFRSIGRFRGDASVRTWLYRIVANSAANLRRSRPTAPWAIDEALEIADPRVDRDPGLVAERHEERTVVVEALRKLPFALRAVVVLRDIYDLPHEAIAVELGISSSAAKVRLHRARKLLRIDLDRQRTDRGRGRDLVVPHAVTTIRSRRRAVSTHTGEGRARAV